MVYLVDALWSWLHCPHCDTKLRIVRSDTTAQNLPLYCKKCKAEYVADIQRGGKAALREIERKGVGKNGKENNPGADCTG